MSDSHASAGFLAPEPADLAPLFPGYEIQGLIATGGMGAVYCAVQRSLDRMVALKILPMEFSKDAAFCAGFEAEAKAMARLNHPNLIGVFDFGEVNGMLYIIMEFVPGKSLYHSAHGIAIDPSEVVRLVTGVCNGLAHAHENGILHRDIKPSNILLDLNAQPKIGDFGLARPIEWKIEEGEEIFGTPHYTAPEVVDSPHSVDYRADIFSVGVLLHELLTGKLPSDDTRPASTISRCDPRFDTIIRRATQPVPAARYSSASQIAADLQVIAASLTPKVPRTAAIAAPRRVQPGRTYAAKSKKSSSAPMLALLVFVAAIAAYFYLKKPSAAVVPPVIVIPAPEHSNNPERTVMEPLPDLTPVPNAGHEPKPHHDTPTDPETVPEKTAGVDPAPAVSAAPKYDVTEFFGRARKIMQDRASPIINVYHASVRNNVSDFEGAVKRQVRKMKLNSLTVDKAVDKAFSDWRDEGERMPKALEDKLNMVDNADSLHEEYIKKQVALDDAFQQSLSQLGGTYILGLEKQIERLKADNDSGAISLIEHEIEQTKNAPEYFPGLMMGDGSSGNQ